MRHERADADNIDALRVIEIISDAPDGRLALLGLQRAVSAWVARTDEGRAAWEKSAQDLNIGDLASFFDPQGNPCASLRPHLAAQGIHRVKDEYVLTDSARVSYDRILVNHQEP